MIKKTALMLLSSTLLFSTSSFSQGVGVVFENFENEVVSIIDGYSHVDSTNYYVQCFLNYENYIDSAICNAKANSSDGSVSIRNSFSFECTRNNGDIECTRRLEF